MKGWKKAVCGTLIAAFMLPQVILDGGNAAEAAGGTWRHNSKGWWYSYPDGSYAKNTWEKIGTRWYYFDANGYMVTGWKQIGKKWYFFNNKGQMVTGWLTLGEKKYYLNSSGAMVTGWKKISGKWYFFKQTGVMTTGWRKISGKWYYFFINGPMATGPLYGKEDYLFDADGVWMEPVSDLTKANAGNLITFGRYEQDNDTSNGAEDIQWIVLKKYSDGRLLAVSRYGLDCQPYNTVDTDVTWGDCTLRTWLNTTFLNAAFTADEKAMIPKTVRMNDDNPVYGTDAGDDTKDQVFLLSRDEAEKYFKNDDTPEGKEKGYSEIRACAPTEYARLKGAYYYEWWDDYEPAELEKYNWNGIYWLRSPGSTTNSAENVYYYGSTNSHAGWTVTDSERLVRPAIIIKP